MTVLFTTTTEAEARLIRKDKIVAENGFALTRGWPFLDNQTADTLSTILDAVATYSNPKANNQTYTGTFVNSKVELIEGPLDSDDRADRIEQTLILVSAIPADQGGQESADALATLTPQITQENEILQPFALTTGEEDTVAFIYSNINPASRNNCIAIPDADLVSQIADANTSGITWTYVTRKFEQLKDNTGRFTLLFRAVGWNAWDESSPNLTEKQNEGTEHEQLVETWFRVQNSDLATIESEIYNNDTDYNVMRVNIRENADGSLRIQRTQWHEAQGASGSELEADTTDTLDKFALQTGTIQRVIIVNEALKDKATAYLTLDSGKTGYTLIKTEEQFRKGDGLWDVYRTYEKVTWLAWDHDSGAADETEYIRAGSDDAESNGSEREGIIKTWHGIQNGDEATGMAALRGGTGNFAPTAGHIVTDASVRDNQNGSLTFTQTQRKQIDNKDQDREQHTNPLGFEDGKLEFITTLYDDFTKTGLDAAVAGESAPSGYALLDSREDIKSNGLWSYLFIYIKATWTNTSGTTPNRVLATRVIYGHTNYDPENDTAGFQRRKTDGGDGVPNAAAEEIFANEAADAGFAVDRLVLSEAANGEVRIRKTQTKARGTGDGIEAQFTSNEGRQQEAERILWINLSASDATLVYDDAVTNKADMTGSSYEAPGAGHVLSMVERRPRPNGFIDIVRVTYIPRGRTTIRFIIGTQDPWRIYCSGFADSYGTYIQKIITESRMVTTSEASARAHAMASSLHPVHAYRLGSVQFNDSYEVYVAIKVTVQDFTDGGSFDFDNSG